MAWLWLIMVQGSFCHPGVNLLYWIFSSHFFRFLYFYVEWKKRFDGTLTPTADQNARARRLQVFVTGPILFWILISLIWKLKVNKINFLLFEFFFNLICCQIIFDLVVVLREELPKDHSFFYPDMKPLEAKKDNLYRLVFYSD